MNQILYSKNIQKTKIKVLIFILVLLLLVLGFFVFGFLNTKSDKIVKGVSVNSIDLSNMTKSEAELAIKEQQKELNDINYILTYENREISVTGEEISLKFSGDLLEKAYQYGKSGNLVENSLIALKSLWSAPYILESELRLDKKLLEDKIKILLEEEKSVVEHDSYEISGDRIFILKGHDGVNAKLENLESKILERSKDFPITTKVDVETDVQKADRINFDELYEVIYKPSKDATYTQKDDGDVEFKKEEIGMSFDKEKVKAEYDSLKDDEKLTINLVKAIPQITTENLDDILFADILATYKTQYNASNVDRSTNLEVSGRNINGTILLPGEIFSYNKEVGQRTKANGFKEAHVFAGGKVVDGMGGGICQVSSTLYNAILKVDGIEIVERKNHMMYPEYVEPSLDATVVWGSIDFRFKNTRETPIKIVATVKNGVVTTTIYGKKAKDEPIIELESVIEKTIKYTTVTEYDKNLEEGTTIVTQDPVNGYVSKAYKIVKDSNGKEISRTLISSDTYKQTSKIVTVGTKKVEKPVEVVTPTIPEQSTENKNPATDPSSEWPTGWDTPENPYYTGN